MTQDFELRLGFAGDEKVVKVTADDRDIRPWDLDSELKTVGSERPRIDAIAKVTGAARYAFDVKLPGMLHAVIVRSKVPKGRLARLDLGAAEKAPGVRGVVALKQNGARIRFVGDELAAIAATTLDAARDAALAVRVEIDAEPFQTDPAKANGAPATDASGNVTEPWPSDGASGIEQGLAEAEATVTGTWRCEVQTHSALETHGIVAQYDETNGLVVHASTQGTFAMRAGLANTLRLAESKVRVIADHVGGGFGAKLQPGAEAVAAARLAMATKAPVKLMLARDEEHMAVGNRPGAVMQLRAGVAADGTITAFDFRGFGSPGYGGSGAARWPQFYVAGGRRRDAQRDVRTDTDAGRAMRAPGYPQGWFAAEGMLDELARAIRMDPLALRLKNDRSPIRRYEWQLGAERFGWSSAVNANPGRPRLDGDARYLHGAGLSSARWGQMGGPGSAADCRIHRDGTVEIRNGAQDIGTGMKTVMAMLTAEELQIPVERVRVFLGDTNDPSGPGSGGSATTPGMSPAVRHAAALAGAKLTAVVAEHFGVGAAKVARKDGAFVVDGAEPMPFAEACRLLGADGVQARGERFRNFDGYADEVCGCQFAEVSVDTWTGVVRVVRMLAVQDCGTLIAKKLAESQVIGAMIQGLSYALHEQRVIDHAHGRMLNADFLSYKIAGPRDMPTFDVVMVDVRNGKNNVGAAGLGEAPAVAPAAAIANAVSNAIGVSMRHLPITPDKVLAALAAKRG